MATLINSTVDAKLREDEAALSALAAVVAQKREELRAAEEALAEAEESFEWNRLQAYAAADDEAMTFSAAIDEAIDAFERSLVPPAGFEGSAEVYASTDDCGDLSSVESTLDDVLEEISEYRRANVASHLERSVAMLLLVSLRFQRLQLGSDIVKGLADGSVRRAPSASPITSPTRKAGPSSTAAATVTSTTGASAEAAKSIRQQALECAQYDEMRHSLLSEWADTLADVTRAGEDGALLLRLLAKRLGAPFDEVGKSA